MIALIKIRLASVISVEYLRRALFEVASPRIEPN